MEVDTVFVTGANRGIGLEFVKQLVGLPRPPRYIFATYRSRDSINALKAIRDASKKSQVLLIKMDVTKANEVQAARKIAEDMVGDSGLTLLINNAGVAERQAFPSITPENLQFHFKINSAGPVMLFQELLPLLKKSASRKASGTSFNMGVSRAAVFNMSSYSGSIGGVVETSVDLEYPGYKISKAALNMAMRVIAANVKEDGILVVNMCPGWVKTDLGSDGATLEPDESISTMLQTFAKLNEVNHGTFVDRFGNPYPF